MPAVSAALHDQFAAIFGNSRGARRPEDGREAALRAGLGSALANLGAEQQEILRRRGGLDGSPPQSLEEVGEAMGKSRERVRVIQLWALAQLREEDPQMEDIDQLFLDA